MKLTEEQQQQVASVWNQCQRIAATECRVRGLRGDLQRDIIDKALLQTLSAVARNDLSGDAIVSRAKSCAIDCIRVAAIAHVRDNVLTILVPNESGFPVTADDPLTSTDLPVLSDQQIEAVNRHWHRIESLVDVIANQFGIESGLRREFLSAVMLDSAKRIAGTDCAEISELLPIIRKTAESLVRDFCTVD